MNQELVVGPGGYASIGEAVSAAAEGDTVLVHPGRYIEAVVVRYQSIIIRGVGKRDEIIVSCDDGPAFVFVESASLLAGLAIDDSEARSDIERRPAIISGGGSTKFDNLRVSASFGLMFTARDGGAITNSVIAENMIGIMLNDGARTRIEANEIHANQIANISIEGAGTSPLIRANRIHTAAGSGISVEAGADPVIEENDIRENLGAGIRVVGRRSTPHVRANNVHDHQVGVIVGDGARARIENNEISRNGVQVTFTDGGTNGSIRQNNIHDGVSGIHVFDGASPRIEDNQIWAHEALGIWIAGEKSAPLVRGNALYRNDGQGIRIQGASPKIEENTLWENAGAAIDISEDGAAPIVRGNSIVKGYGEGVSVRDGAMPTISDNTIA